MHCHKVPQPAERSPATSAPNLARVYPAQNRAGGPVPRISGGYAKLLPVVASEQRNRCCAARQMIHVNRRDRSKASFLASWSDVGFSPLNDQAGDPMEWSLSANRAGIGVVLR